MAGNNGTPGGREIAFNLVALDHLTELVSILRTQGYFCPKYLSFQTKEILVLVYEIYTAFAQGRAE